MKKAEKEEKKQTWQQIEKRTGINIAVLKAVDLSKKVVRVHGIPI